MFTPPREVFNMEDYLSWVITNQDFNKLIEKSIEQKNRNAGNHKYIHLKNILEKMQIHTPKKGMLRVTIINP